ncbi:uncharacterized protein [Nicotiana tomentosiformis]|uniref:Uncharacterized protein n=1 Tax=Nicotiana tabacum TaxID=4097 RepID=A0A1S3Y6M2_TOBAC|nr:uncharacterized protein LOC104084759 [Nicotiana tomentosiformis]XP_016447866.1 PREDICTED: uncharacterized protein LOC107772923 [Nicotiana tabacum]
MNISEQNLFNTTTTTTTCLFFLLISLSTTTIFFSSGDREAASVFPFIAAAAFAAVVVAGLIVLAVRTTIVAWITVLVLLAFVGKRRRVLAKDGKKITSEVAVYVANEVIKEKGLVAISGVLMILGLMALF